MTGSLVSSDSVLVQRLVVRATLSFQLHQVREQLSAPGAVGLKSGGLPDALLPVLGPLGQLLPSPSNLRVEKRDSGCPTLVETRTLHRVTATKSSRLIPDTSAEVDMVTSKVLAACLSP